MLRIVRLAVRFRSEVLKFALYKKWCNQYGIYNEIKTNFKQRTYPILQFDLNDNLIKEWKCGDDIVKELGFNKSHIQKCCRNEKKTSNGFKWKYKEDII